MKPLPQARLAFALATFAAGVQLVETAYAADFVTTGSRVDAASESAARGSHAPVFSADGRRVAFVSRASNLIMTPDLNASWDVFVLNRDNKDMALASVSRRGQGGGNGHSLLPALSADGSVVVFQSDASDLVAGDDNGVSDIYARNLAVGGTTLVSVNHLGTGTGNGRSWNPLVSADGRYIIFESLASNLVTNDFNGTNDVFIRDLKAGTTSLVSVNAQGTSSPDGPSESPSISVDGLTVAFISRGANLVAGATNRLGEVYVRDVTSQSNHWAVASHLASTRDPQTLAYSASEPILSADGRYVAFKTQRGQIVRFDTQRETNSVVISYPGPVTSAVFEFQDNPRLGGIAGSGPTPDMALSADARYLMFISGPAVIPSNAVFRTDLESYRTNVIEVSGGGAGGTFYLTNQLPVVEIVSTAFATNEPSTGSALSAAMSTNGSVIAFLSDATNLVERSANGTVQLYVRDMDNGPVRLVSTNSGGGLGVSRAGSLPALDPAGRWLASESGDCLVPADVNNAADIYLHELVNGGIELVSEAAADRSSITSAGHSYVRPRGLSADGRLLAFSTLDRGLPRHDTNLNHVVRVRSLSAEPDPAFPKMTNGFQRDAVLSADGRYLAYFRGLPNDSTGFLEFQTVRRDLVTGKEDVFATPLVPAFSQVFREQWAHDLSLDGRYLAHGSKALGVEVFLVLRDLLTGNSNVVSLRVNGQPAAAVNPSFSPDARWIAFVAQGNDLTPAGRPGLHLWDRITQTNRWLTDGMVGFKLTNSFAFSANSEWIAFARSNQVILHHLLEATNLVAFANGHTPAVSGDGRYVVAETTWDGSAPRNIVRFDRETGETRLISRSRIGSGGGNGTSHSPSITADGRFVIFASLAGDLVENDTNGVADIFMRDTLLGTTMLASISQDGTGSGNEPSSRPILGADGRTVMFHSFASDLVEGDYNERRDVFLLRLGGADSDSDGLDDDWELAYFNTLDRDGSGDFDNDSVNDQAEFLAGTSPTNETSILRVLTLTSVNGSGMTLLWSAVPGRSYRVQFKENVEDAGWQEMPGLVTALGSTASASDPGALGQQRYYRVVLAP